MLQKILQLVRPMAAGTAIASPALPAPYRSSAVNQFYNRLFCDTTTDLAPKACEMPATWHSTLGEEPATPEAVRVLALDPSAPGQTRALAWQWLRTRGHPVPRRRMQGVVIETWRAGGLDVLAAYAEGTVRHINDEGEPVACDAADVQLRCAAAHLLAHASRVLLGLTRSSSSRAGPPAQGHVRFSIVAADGLYVDDGPLSLMRHEPLAGRLIRDADELRRLMALAADGRRPLRLHDAVTWAYAA